MNKNQKDQNQPRKPNVLISLVFFPFKVAGEYNLYFRKIRKILEIVPNSKEYSEIRNKLETLSARLSWQKNMLLVMPFLICLIAIASSLYRDRDNVEEWYLRAKKVGMFIVTEEGKRYLKINRSSGVKKIIGSVVRGVPLNKSHLVLALCAYSITVMGAVYLRDFDGFKYNTKLTKMFLSKKFVDDEGKPWEVYWTPYAILIYAYMIEPETIAKRFDIWSTVNFKAGQTHKDDKNHQTFVLLESIDLPKSIQIKVPSNLNDMVSKKDKS